MRFVVVRNGEEVTISPPNELTSELTVVCRSLGDPELRDKGYGSQARTWPDLCSRQFPGPPGHAGVFRGLWRVLCTQESGIFHHLPHGHPPSLGEGPCAVTMWYKENKRKFK